MKNKQIIMAFIVIIAMQQSANAASCTCSNRPTGAYCTTACIQADAGCQLYTCDSGTQHCALSNPCSSSSGGGGSLCYTVGESVSSDYGNGCARYSDTLTTIIMCDSCKLGAGSAQSKTITLCDNGGTVTKYMCTPALCMRGKYANAFGNCVDCPNDGTTAGNGPNAITDCYQPAGAAFTDDAGSGTYTSDCYYTK